MRERGIKQPVLVIFDCGYPSIKFSDFLEAEGLHYLIRLSSNDYKAERKQMQSEDKEVILKHSFVCLQKYAKNIWDSM
ncbi:MAG: transposase [Lachnospiraceae bacterium]|nr:transposase [Lachnospiraceae bacterium]